MSVSRETLSSNIVRGPICVAAAVVAAPSRCFTWNTLGFQVMPTVSTPYKGHLIRTRLPLIAGGRMYSMRVAAKEAGTFCRWHRRSFLGPTNLRSTIKLRLFFGGGVSRETSWSDGTNLPCITPMAGDVPRETSRGKHRQVPIH